MTDSGLAILHLGSGFRPWRRGGLVAYAEDLMVEQVRRGNRVSYLFSGRHYPRLAGPRLKRWGRGGVSMLEIVNSPLYDHGRQPDLEMSEPRVEQMLRRVLGERSFDVVHVQELAGLPFSVLDVLRDAGLPTVLTLQDYFLLCPTFKLLDAEGSVCVRRSVGSDCVATTAADDRVRELLFDATLRYELERRRPLRLVPPRHRNKFSARVAAALAPSGRPTRDELSPPATFQERRDSSIRRLNGVDCTIAMSRRVAELHTELGVDPERLRTMRLTLAHIERLHPRGGVTRVPVTFATLGGGESVTKGAALLLEAARLLADAAPGRFRLLFFGHVTPAVASAAEMIRGVEVPGPYSPDQLDVLLDEVDVGVMPSIWEEAYGYAGIEFLAKAIPVVGNPRGGVVDYVRDGESGWLNRSCTAAGLGQILLDIVERPEQVDQLSHVLRERRSEFILPFARHVDELETVYREVIANAAQRASP